jgi:hypothetical protein
MGTVELLRAAGVGVGDEVVVPAFGDSEPAEAALLAGAVPVFADIDPATYCLDPTAVEAVVSPRTAAVVVVHRFGHPAPLDSLHAVGRRHGLLVLERSEHGSPSVELASRRERAAYLDRRLRGVRTPQGGAAHTYAQYVVRAGRPRERGRLPGAGEDARAPHAGLSAGRLPAGDRAGRRRDAGTAVGRGADKA